MSATRLQNWHQVKAKIIARFGSLKACGHAIDATPEAIRLTVQGKCPRTKRKLEIALR